MATFRGENNQVVRGISLNISSDVCDGIPPQVMMLTLNPTVVSNAQASVITVHAEMVDEGGCGASTLSAQAIPPGTKVAALDSAKQAHYLPAILGVQAWFGSTRDCIQAAVTGRWNGERP
jgi:hypothetical protein